MKSVLEVLFGGAHRGKRSSSMSCGGLAPLRVLPIRPHAELAEVVSHYSSPFAAAIDGQLNGEEYLLLENGDDDE